MILDISSHRHTSYQKWPIYKVLQRQVHIYSCHNPSLHTPQCWEWILITEGSLIAHSHASYCQLPSPPWFFTIATSHMGSSCGPELVTPKNAVLLLTITFGNCLSVLRPLWFIIRAVMKWHCHLHHSFQESCQDTESSEGGVTAEVLQTKDI